MMNVCLLGCDKEWPGEVCEWRWPADVSQGTAERRSQGRSPGAETPMYFPNTFQRSSRIDRRKQRVNSRHKISFRIRVIYLFLFQFHDNFKLASVAN